MDEEVMLAVILLNPEQDLGECQTEIKKGKL